jgi:hypothetical protein
LDDFSRHVDGETVRDIVDENERIECWNEIEGARSDIEESMRWGFHKGYILVGQGRQTKEDCGKWGRFKGCLRIGDHKGMVFDVNGNVVDVSGKVYMVNSPHSCDRFSCPKCYKRAAYRESIRAEERIIEGSKRFGLADHIVCSVPLHLYDVDEVKLRAMAIRILRKCGVIGGSLTFHGFRYESGRGWYWSPHFHSVSWILGGYKCRKCEKFDYASKSVCVGCDGFENVVRKMNEIDKWIVKVARDRSGKAGVRKSIGKTLAYELAHASIREGERARVITWWGVAGCRKMKVTHERLKSLCPLCKHELVEYEYVGCDIDVLRRVKWGVGGSFYDVLVDGKGFANYVKVERDKFGRRVR